MLVQPISCVIYEPLPYVVSDKVIDFGPTSHRKTLAGRSSDDYVYTSLEHDSIDIRLNDQCSIGAEVVIERRTSPLVAIDRGYYSTTGLSEPLTQSARSGEKVQDRRSSVGLQLIRDRFRRVEFQFLSPMPPDLDCWK